MCGPTVYTVAKWLTYNKVCILIEVNVVCLVIKTVECGGMSRGRLKLSMTNNTHIITPSHPHTRHTRPHTGTGCTTVQAVLHGYSIW